MSEPHLGVILKVSITPTDSVDLSLHSKPDSSAGNTFRVCNVRGHGYKDLDEFKVNDSHKDHIDTTKRPRCCVVSLLLILLLFCITMS